VTEPTIDPAAPRVLLTGADQEQARSLAMGAAVTKGWRLAESDSNLVVMQRPLSPAIAESVVPGSSQGPRPAQIEVKTLFLPRADGTVVALQADLLTTDAKGEVRHSFTERYRPELERSLASLRRAWEGANWRIAGAAPPLPEPAPPARFEEDAESEAPMTSAASDDQALASMPATQSPPAAPPPVSAPPVSAPPAAQPPAPSRVSPAPAAVVDASPRPAPVASAAPAPVPAASGNMLTLNRASPATGIWAYYAEHYARVRGCRLAGDGAVLLRQTPEYEEHRVYCEGGQNFMVRCNAGICRGLQ